MVQKALSQASRHWKKKKISRGIKHQNKDIKIASQGEYGSKEAEDTSPKFKRVQV